MPELPEVETSRKGIAPSLENQEIIDVIIREHRLRWPIPKKIKSVLINQKVETIQRRGKYLLLQCKKGTLIIHLGMSGSLRILQNHVTPEKHDHVDIVLANHQVLRFTDPRRFGAMLWTDDDPIQHQLLKDLGPEPLSKQ